MASVVGIVNAAINKLGLRSIVSLDDNRTEARLASDTYEDLRDAVLRDHAWNFATRRVSLTANSTAPTWGYAHSYPLPADPYYFLRILEIEKLFHYKYKIEGRELLIDLPSPINISYIWRVTDPNLMDTLFREALAARLAMEWCEKLVRTANLLQALTQQYQAKLSEARTVDGQEGTTDVVAESRWIEARW